MGGCGCSGNQKASMIFKDCGCGCKGKKQEHKFIISIMSAMIFFVVANPETFRAMRGIVGGWVSSPTGCPTIKGLALHTVVFMLVVWGLMNIRKEGQENPPPEEQMGAEMPPPPLPVRLYTNPVFHRSKLEDSIARFHRAGGCPTLEEAPPLAETPPAGDGCRRGRFRPAAHGGIARGPRASATAPCGASASASSTCWSRPTSRPAASTSRRSRT